MSRGLPFMLTGDVWRIGGKASWSALLRALLTQRNFKVVFTLRLCQALARSKGPLRLLLLPCTLLHRLMRHHAGMDFPWQTPVGAGLSIQHGWGMVINRNARIGSNVTLYHGVTIGQGDRLGPDGTRVTGYPVIEDEVWIGPHAIVVGGITVGRGARILGGAFVTKDVPPFSLVIGNPARIKRTGAPDVLNKYPVATSADETVESATGGNAVIGVNAASHGGLP